MSIIRAALYARVSTDLQSQAHTIDSQIEAILERSRLDGSPVPPEYRFVDDGVSGSLLVRPSLERLRDLVAAGRVDRIYVHSPDRLARNYVHQVILTEEFDRSGVEVMFLNQPVEKTPEGALFLQMQGLFAEYERGKLIERVRRGRRHSAKCGHVSALTAVPYGYRYISKSEGNDQARMEIHPEEAETVRQIFEWVACDRLTLNEVCRRLAAQGICSPKGCPEWTSTTILFLLLNPAYIGQAAFGRTRQIPWRKPLRPHRGHPEYPKVPCAVTSAPKEDWITIPCPALVDRDWFEVAQEQLARNREKARARREGARTLLQGLIVCTQCHSAYIRHTQVTTNTKGEQVTYAYYRCNGKVRTPKMAVPGRVLCENRPVEATYLDEHVWRAVEDLLNDPARVEAEYLRRLQQLETRSILDLGPINRELAKLKRSLATLIDGFVEGLVEKTEFEPRAKGMRERLQHLQTLQRESKEAASATDEIHFLVGKLETFAARVRDGLATADWKSKREVIRAIVKRVEITPNDVTIVFRVGEAPPTDPPGIDFWSDRSRLYGRGWRR